MLNQKKNLKLLEFGRNSLILAKIYLFLDMFLFRQWWKIGKGTGKYGFRRCRRLYCYLPTLLIAYPFTKAIVVDSCSLKEHIYLACETLCMFVDHSLRYTASSDSCKEKRFCQDKKLPRRHNPELMRWCVCVASGKCSACA